MCYLLTFAVPSQVTPSTRTRGFHIAPHSNEGGGHVYAAGMSVFSITSGECSCGLVSSGRSEADSGKTEKLRRKYEKQGWSQAKISRALGDRSEQQSQKTVQPLRPDIEAYLNDELKQSGYL